MTIATIDAALAGFLLSGGPRRIAKVASPAVVIGRPQSLWALAGTVGAGAFDTTLNGVNLVGNAVAGQIPRSNPASGNAHLGRLSAGMSQAGSLLVCDRLWHNGGYTITTTGAQNTTQPTLPARDINGATSGDGVLIGLEVSANCGAAAPAPTISYTNQAGTSGRSAGLAFPTANSPLAGSFFPFALQAGDTGVRSVQSLSLNTSWVSGTVNLVAYRILAEIPIYQANVANELDVLTSGMPRVYDNSVPFLIAIGSVAAALSANCTYVETQG